jgi:hypothetical protein
MTPMENTNGGNGRYVTEAMYLADRNMIMGALKDLTTALESLSSELRHWKQQLPVQAVEQYKDETVVNAKLWWRDRRWATGLVILSNAMAAGLAVAASHLFGT